MGCIGYGATDEDEAELDEMRKKRKKGDERFVNLRFLKYNLICYKCDKSPKDCKCDDKWFRLHTFDLKLRYARVMVNLGGASSKERELVNKHGI